MSSLDILLNRTTPKIRNTILELRKFLLQLSNDVEEQCTKRMITYHTRNISITPKKGRRTKGLFWINLTKGSVLRVHLRKKGNYQDKFNRIVPEGWGEYPEITFKENEINNQCLEYLKSLISEAYNTY